MSAYDDVDIPDDELARAIALAMTGQPAGNGSHESADPPTKRKRGAQSGNLNARKHGFYARVLTPEEQEALDQAAVLRGLQSEIALMRVKFMALASQPDTPTELLVKMARAIARLVTVHERTGYGYG